jgi:hypothetical protein
MTDVTQDNHLLLAMLTSARFLFAQTPLALASGVKRLWLPCPTSEGGSNSTLVQPSSERRPPAPVHPEALAQPVLFAKQQERIANAAAHMTVIYAKKTVALARAGVPGSVIEALAWHPTTKLEQLAVEAAQAARLAADFAHGAVGLLQSTRLARIKAPLAAPELAMEMQKLANKAEALEHEAQKLLEEATAVYESTREPTAGQGSEAGASGPKEGRPDAVTSVDGPFANRNNASLVPEESHEASVRVGHVRYSSEPSVGGPRKGDEVQGEAQGSNRSNQEVVGQGEGGPAEHGTRERDGVARNVPAEEMTEKKVAPQATATGTEEGGNVGKLPVNQVPVAKVQQKRVQSVEKVRWESVSGGGRNSPKKKVVEEEREVATDVTLEGTRNTTDKYGVPAEKVLGEAPSDGPARQKVQRKRSTGDDRMQAKQTTQETGTGVGDDVPPVAKTEEENLTVVPEKNESKGLDDLPGEQIAGIQAPGKEASGNEPSGGYDRRSSQRGHTAKPPVSRDAQSGGGSHTAKPPVSRDAQSGGGSHTAKPPVSRDAQSRGGSHTAKPPASRDAQSGGGSQGVDNELAPADDVQSARVAVDEPRAGDSKDLSGNKIDKDAQKSRADGDRDGSDGSDSQIKGLGDGGPAKQDRVVKKVGVIGKAEGGALLQGGDESLQGDATGVWNSIGADDLRVGDEGRGELASSDWQGVGVNSKPDKSNSSLDDVVRDVFDLQNEGADSEDNNDALTDTGVKAPARGGSMGREGEGRVAADTNAPGGSADGDGNTGVEGEANASDDVRANGGGEESDSKVVLDADAGNESAAAREGRGHRNRDGSAEENADDVDTNAVGSRGGDDGREDSDAEDSSRDGNGDSDDMHGHLIGSSSRGGGMPGDDEVAEEEEDAGSDEAEPVVEPPDENAAPTVKE